MRNQFSSLRLFFLSAFVWLLHTNAPLYSQTRTDQSFSSKEGAPYFEKTDLHPKEGDLNPATYSKNGSDSLSLVIFGKVVVPKAALVKTVTSSKTSVAAKQQEAKQKEKFNIKSSDKLKTNNSLY